MGFLLVLGVVSCFIASVVLLPAVMRIFFGDKTSKEQQKEANDA
jgi:predicted RND superfamily exporter protein